MPISINPELEALLRARAEAAGVAVQTYLERIARDEEAAEAEIEALAIEGLSSGDSIDASPRYWEEKRQRLINRHRKPGSR